MKEFGTTPTVVQD